MGDGERLNRRNPCSKAEFVQPGIGIGIVCRTARRVALCHRNGMSDEADWRLDLSSYFTSSVLYTPRSGQSSIQGTRNSFYSCFSELHIE